MAKKPPPRPEQKWMHGEVDRLLQQLGPDTPTSARRGPSRPAATRPATSKVRPRPRPQAGPRPSSRPLPITLPSPLGVWARVAPGAALVGALTQWPYGYCGLPLVAYLIAIVIVLGAGTWAAHAAWRRRMGRAHLAALSIMFAAATLAAAHVLPRLGDPSIRTIWRCVG